MEKLSKEEVEKIKKNPEKIDWSSISYCQKLSEEFIKEFQDKIDWHYISWYQKLSENFILEFYDKVNWISLEHKFNKEMFKNMNRGQKLYMIMNYKKLWNKWKN